MNTINLQQGDCLELLKTIADNSIDCIVTSPPYWALRDYGVEGQLGQEPTFQEYIENLCNIFDEVKRVLKPQGTCWVNLGDTYSGTGSKKDSKDPKYKEGRNGQTVAKNNKTSVPSKSLCCIPDRFKIEMVNRGWICRNEIIWHKANCMPSSVKDRFTVDYEKVFFFVKSKKYYFEQQLEELAESSIKAKNYKLNQTTHIGANKSAVNVQLGSEARGNRFVPDKGRNKRSVWKVNTVPFKEAHFATYPEKLIEPMIKAGCPIGGIVLDPFAGAGTTGLVALKQNKNFIGLEINPEYIKIAENRLNLVNNSIFS